MRPIRFEGTAGSGGRRPFRRQHEQHHDATRILLQKMMYNKMRLRSMVKKGCLALLGVFIALVLFAIGMLYYQGRRSAEGRAQYVALGSSFASGFGLGARDPSSPAICARSVNGYPKMLAHMLHLSLVDVSCSGATTAHVLLGGQMFLRPQVDAVRPHTQLVTLTIGGNDLHYVGDLLTLSARRSGTLYGSWLRLFGAAPAPASKAEYRKVEKALIHTVRLVRHRAPHAKILLVSYPPLLPRQGSCPKLGLSPDEAKTMRVVGDRLADITRSAAQISGAVLVDMHRLGLAHDACSAQPWVNGARKVVGAKFHPTLAGSLAVAGAVSETLRGAPRGQDALTR